MSGKAGSVDAIERGMAPRARQGAPPPFYLFEATHDKSTVMSKPPHGRAWRWFEPVIKIGYVFPARGPGAGLQPISCSLATALTVRVMPFSAASAPETSSSSRSFTGMSWLMRWVVLPQITKPW